MGADGTYDLSVNVSDGNGGTADAQWNLIIDRTGPLVPPPDGDDGGAGPVWALLALIALCIITAVLLLFAWSKRRKGRGKDAPDSDDPSE
jgi:hypothetical protein